MPTYTLTFSDLTISTVVQSVLNLTFDPPAPAPPPPALFSFYWYLTSSGQKNVLAVTATVTTTDPPASFSIAPAGAPLRPQVADLKLAAGTSSDASVSWTNTPPNTRLDVAIGSQPATVIVHAGAPPQGLKLTIKRP